NQEAVYGTTCSEKEAQILDNGIELRYTDKDGQEYLFIDNIQGDAAEIEIEAVSNDIIPLNQNLRGGVKTE
ncbi:hypothetical protein, partial [Extibacter sp. GGCC_0201]|uniref:hypothetical protein n=1 Tax=Extibacter sp. GGCC_0201 TaxID=2731209 RepID=UPI002ED3ACE0|nr:alpha-L-fucosidase [Extibacter sp. GGCC_0201]